MRLRAPYFPVLSLVAASILLSGCSDNGFDPDVAGLVDARVRDSAALAFTGTAAGNMNVAIHSTGRG